MSDRQVILAVFAHPDDEVFGTGATLARYAASGATVALVCATRGEVGEISDPSLATPETLGNVREQELRCSCQALGISELFFLGYRDSGMAGTDDNRHPWAFINAASGEAIGKVVKIIRQLRPQVLITFDRGGGYGHPDHIRIHEVTTEAFLQAGDPARYPEQLSGGLQPYSPQHLYYTAVPRSLFRDMLTHLNDLGVDTGPFGQLDVERIGTADEAITVAVDVSAFVNAKLRAFACHRTQMGPDNAFSRLPEAIRRGFMVREHFVEYGAPHTGVSKTDLFAGSRL